MYVPAAPPAAPDAAGAASAHCPYASALFFLFYFNRVFAKVISILVRLYLRWSGSPRYIDIQSLQISFLGGRIFFGRVVYHGTNESITVVGGHVTWRYWLRRVRQAAITSEEADKDSDGTGKRKEALPCRILVELKGLEWFVYNRSPAYDSIAEQMAAEAPPNDDYAPPSTPAPSQATEKIQENLEDDKQASRAETTASRASHSTRVVRLSEESVQDMIAKSPFLRMLPLGFECSRGSVVMGNNNTPSILVAHFDGATGVVDAGKVLHWDRGGKLGCILTSSTSLVRATNTSSSLTSPSASHLYSLKPTLTIRSLCTPVGYGLSVARRTRAPMILIVLHYGIEPHDRNCEICYRCFPSPLNPWCLPKMLCHQNLLDGRVRIDGWGWLDISTRSSLKRDGSLSLPSMPE